MAVANISLLQYSKNYDHKKVLQYLLFAFESIYFESIKQQFQIVAYYNTATITTIKKFYSICSRPLASIYLESIK
jgi:hypothetical protein